MGTCIVDATFVLFFDARLAEFDVGYEVVKLCLHTLQPPLMGCFHLSPEADFYLDQISVRCCCITIDEEACCHPCCFELKLPWCVLALALCC